MANFRIESIFAFIAVDPEDGDEGVVAEFDSEFGAWVPFIAADADRLRSLELRARAFAQRNGRVLRLVRFSQRENISEIVPPQHG